MARLPSLAAAAGLAALHLLSVRLRAPGAPRAAWLSAAGGVAVAYVFVDILPGLAEQQAAWIAARPNRPLEWLAEQIYFAALAGLVLSYGLLRATSHVERRFALRIGGFAVYNALVGYLTARMRGASLAIWFLALGAHFVVSDTALRRDYPEHFQRRGRWVLAAAVLLGWGAHQLGEVAPPVVAAITGLLGGSILLDTLKEEVPSEREGRFLPFLAGTAGYSLLYLVLLYFVYTDR